MSCEPLTAASYIEMRDELWELLSKWDHVAKFEQKTQSPDQLGRSVVMVCTMWRDGQQDVATSLENVFGEVVPLP